MALVMFSVPYSDRHPLHHSADDADGAGVKTESEVSSELDPSELTGACRRFCPHPTNINPNPSQALPTNFRFFSVSEYLDFLDLCLNFQET